jgi:(p)ppGpp synthase/HD superfamily hydrolase
MSMIKEAYDFAVWAHDGQTYGNDMPYSYHFGEVVKVLSDEGFRQNENLIAAACLHDVFEDTGIPIDVIQECFGDDVARLVDAVSGFGSRQEQQGMIKTKILQYPDAAVLKLADRIANVEYGVLCEGGKHLQRYLDENPEFETYIKPNVPAEMWERLMANFEYALEKGYIISNF